ncbi:DsbA family protein [Ornithinimicrobium cavernae]|uniref:DsbA family protein n=1 Tax=Ornithinimicrobium cavernae TaxID=2666047 RepID=UPI00192A4653|nr:thioredoxin domain-containing protein [Ornithinimicrobium cavernae]
MSTPSGQVPPGNDQPSAPIAPIPQTSGPSRGSSASTMWAIATIVVALVGGFLIYTAMTQDDGTAPAAPQATADGPGQVADEGAEAAGSTATPGTTEPSEAARPTMTDEQRQFLLDLPRREADDPLAQGDVDAPVVIIEYADYRCPFCASWGREVHPQLQDLIDDGTVRLEFRDRILFGEDSEATALAARAAGEQGLYWEYQQAVFEAAPESGHPDMPREKLLGLAEEVGVPDLATFEADLDSPELRSAMEADQAEGESLGVRSTPTFLVNTQALIGAQPEQAFRQAIEQELAKVEGQR